MAARPSTIRPQEAAVRPEMTALAACHISFSPLSFSFSLKMGMNAAVSAPSPRSRRNKFGTMNAR
jgi:hypothetical protein